MSVRQFFNTFTFYFTCLASTCQKKVFDSLGQFFQSLFSEQYQAIAFFFEGSTSHFLLYFFFFFFCCKHYFSQVSLPCVMSSLYNMQNTTVVFIVLRFIVIKYVFIGKCTVIEMCDKYMVLTKWKHISAFPNCQKCQKYFLLNLKRKIIFSSFFFVALCWRT